MTAKIWAGLFVTLALSMGGQSFLRKGVTRAIEDAGVGVDVLFRRHLLDLLFSPLVFTGCVLSALGAVSWLYVLGHYELSRALPLLGGLAYMTLFVVGRFWLGERTNLSQFLGIVLLVSGMFLLTRKS